MSHVFNNNRVTKQNKTKQNSFNGNSSLKSLLLKTSFRVINSALFLSIWDQLNLLLFMLNWRVILASLIQKTLECLFTLSSLIIICYLDHSLPFLPAFSAGSTATRPVCPLCDHTINGWSLRMILVMVDAHIWFVHSIETTEIIIKLVWQGILSTS